MHNIATYITEKLHFKKGMKNMIKYNVGDKCLILSVYIKNGDDGQILPDICSIESIGTDSMNIKYITSLTHRGDFSAEYKKDNSYKIFVEKETRHKTAILISIIFPHDMSLDKVNEIKEENYSLSLDDVLNNEIGKKYPVVRGFDRNRIDSDDIEKLKDALKEKSVTEKLHIKKGMKADNDLEDKCYVIPYGRLENCCQEEYENTMHENNLGLYGYIVDRDWLKEYLIKNGIKKLDEPNPRNGKSTMYELPIDKYDDIDNIIKDLEKTNFEVKDLKRIINTDDL